MGNGEEIINFLLFCYCFSYIAIKKLILLFLDVYYKCVVLFLLSAMKMLAVIFVLACINAKECKGMVLNLGNRDSLRLTGDPVGEVFLRAGTFVRDTLARCDLLLAAHRLSPILSFRDK